MYPYICLFIVINREEKLKGRIDFQTRSNDRPIDRNRVAEFTRIRSNRQMASRTSPLRDSVARDWPLAYHVILRLGWGLAGTAVPRLERRVFVVVVFTPRCLKPSSRVSFWFGLE